MAFYCTLFGSFYLLPSLSVSLFLSFIYWCLVPSLRFHNLPWVSRALYLHPSSVFYEIPWDSLVFSQSLSFLPWDSMTFYGLSLPVLSFSFLLLPSMAFYILPWSVSWYSLGFCAFLQWVPSCPLHWASLVGLLVFLFSYSPVFGLPCSWPELCRKGPEMLKISLSPFPCATTSSHCFGSLGHCLRPWFDGAGLVVWVWWQIR